MTTSDARKTKKVSAAHAKAHLSEIVARVEHTGERYVIERRGKPVAAVVPVGDLEGMESARPHAAAREPRGLAAWVGAWADVPDEEIDRMIADIYEARDREVPRPVDLQP